MENKKNFILQAFILASAGILVRVIGLLYRIPLIRIVKEEGMGYYSQAFNIYSIILLISSYSLPLAVSKMISKRLAKKDYKNANRVFVLALIYASIVGFLGFGLVWFFAESLASLFFRMPLSAYALRALAPTILVMAYLGVFRGYYQGKSNMLPTAVSQILEQLANAIMSVFAAKYLSEMAIKNFKSLSEVRAYGAMGGTIGTGTGAFVALLMFLLIYFIALIKKSDKVKTNDFEKESFLKISKDLLFIVLPVILSTAIYNINGIIDGIIFGHSSFYFGLGSITVKEYGIYTGKYLVLIYVPIAIANSLSSSLIPELSKALAKEDKKTLFSSISLALKTTLLIALPASVALMILARPIMSILFGESIKASLLMNYGSFAILFYSLSTIMNAILQGTNYINIPLKNASLSLLIHVVFLLLLLYLLKGDSLALVFANMIFALFMCIFNFIAIRKYLKYDFELRKTLSLPILCSFILGILIYALYKLFYFVIGSDFISLILVILLSLFSYPILLVLTKTVKEEELNSSRFTRKILRVFKKLRLL